MASLKVKITGEKQFRNKDAEALIKKAAVCAFDSFGFDFKGQLDVTMTGEQGIKEMNMEFRQVDSATDVLSFPMTEFFCGQYDGDIEAELDPDTGLVPLGDMVINASRAREQAEEYGHSFERECAYLTVHSMLHLLGFDHMEPDDKRVMREKEEQIMETLNLKR